MPGSTAPYFTWRDEQGGEDTTRREAVPNATGFYPRTLGLTSTIARGEQPQKPPHPRPHPHPHPPPPAPLGAVL